MHVDAYTPLLWPDAVLRSALAQPSTSEASSGLAGRHSINNPSLTSNAFAIFSTTSRDGLRFPLSISLM